MGRARKKPVEIEFFRMSPERRWDNEEWPEWLNAAWNEQRETVGSIFPKLPPIGETKPDDDRLRIGTLEGELTIDWNDCIIQGVNGELYPCKPNIFAKTYDVIED